MQAARYFCTFFLFAFLVLVFFCCVRIGVAELGSLSPGAKMAMKIFVERVFTILASNASFFVRNRKLAKLTQ